MLSTKTHTYCHKQYLRALAVLFIALVALSGLKYSPEAYATPSHYAFIDILGDVPMMPEMEIEPESTLIFDKASGRYIEALTTLPLDTANNEITAFYQKTLPLLGWTKISVEEYHKDDETLKILIENNNDAVIVRFIASPAKK